MQTNPPPRCKGALGLATCSERGTCALYHRYKSDPHDTRYVRDGNVGIKLYNLPRVAGQACHFKDSVR